MCLFGVTPQKTPWVAVVYKLPGRKKKKKERTGAYAGCECMLVGGKGQRHAGQGEMHLKKRYRQNRDGLKRVSKVEGGTGRNQWGSLFFFFSTFFTFKCRTNRGIVRSSSSSLFRARQGKWRFPRFAFFLCSDSEKPWQIRRAP